MFFLGKVEKISKLDLYTKPLIGQLLNNRKEIRNDTCFILTILTKLF